MIDLLVVVLVAGAAVLGWLRGLSISLLAGLAFMVAGIPGAALAAALGAPAPVVGYLIGGLLGLVPFVLRGAQIQAWVDSLLGDSRLRSVDRFAGAVLNVGIAMCLTWFVAAVAAIVPGDSGALSAMRSSAVLTSLVETLPPQGGLGVVVLRSGLVPGINGPLVLAEAPDPRSAVAPRVVAARSSVLQVRSTACGQVVTGTGWVAGSGVVVTNAHVVAGSKRSFLAGGPTYDGVEATVVAIDLVNDVAVLVLDAAQVALPAPLPIVTRVRHGERAAVIGFPRNGEQRVDAARIDRVADYAVRPLGGGPTVPAPVLALRAHVEPGNSGGPVVAEDGSVLGVVVSKGLGQRVDAAYGVPSATLLPLIAKGAARVPTGTGPCLDEEDLTTEQQTS